MTSPDFQTTLHLNRIFKASRERVFRAWTQADLLEKWFHPVGFHTKVSTLELRVGGAYRLDLTGPNGEHSAFSGNYLEIVPPSRLVFTWVSEATNGEQTLVTLDFIERDGFTEVRLTHDRMADEAMILAHRLGWEACLEQLPTVLGVLP